MSNRIQIKTEFVGGNALLMEQNLNWAFVIYAAPGMFSQIHDS